MASDIIESRAAEINNILNKIVGDPGPRWPGLTYEQGVRSALEWLIGDDDHPLEGM